MPRENTRHAAVAHRSQQNSLRLPRGLPAAPEALPTGVGAAVGGVGPPSRHRSRNQEALEGQGGTAQHAELCGAPGGGGLLRPGPPVPRLSGAAGAEVPKGRHTRPFHQKVTSRSRTLLAARRCVKGTAAPSYGIVRAGPATGNLPGSGLSRDARGASWPRSTTG